MVVEVKNSYRVRGQPTWATHPRVSPTENGIPLSSRNLRSPDDPDLYTSTRSQIPLFRWTWLLYTAFQN